MQLFQHQENIVNDFPAKSGLVWGTGTGKTIATIALANKAGCPLLVICPKGLRNNWERNLSKRCEVKYVVVSKEEFRRDWKSLDEYQSVIVDEAHYFFGTKSQMMKSLKGYFKKWNVAYRWLATATPYRSTPMDVYVMAQLLDVPMNYPYFKSSFFKEQYFGKRVVMVPRKNIEDDLAQVLQGFCSIIKMEDCFDVPEQNFVTEYFSLSKQQQKAIDSLEEILPIQRYVKEHQICGGTLKGDEYSDDQHFGCDKKDRLVELVQNNNTSIVVCRYNNEIDMLAKELGKKTDKTIRFINGAVDNRQEILDELEASDNWCLLVNAAVSEGWELKKCPTMIFYSYDFQLINYIQMLGRIQRADNLKKNTYISLVTQESIDESVVQSITNKTDFHIAIYTDERSHLHDKTTTMDEVSF